MDCFIGNFNFFLSINLLRYYIYIYMLEIAIRKSSITIHRILSILLFVLSLNVLLLYCIINYDLIIYSLRSN